MAVQTDIELGVLAQQVADETAPGANTADRVGTILQNIIDSKPNIDTIPKVYAARGVAVLTGAPSVTTGNNTTGATVTWARTGTGTYTLTSSSAIFTSGKTLIMINGFGDAIPKFICRNYTSTSVITLTALKMEDLSLEDGFDIDVLILIYP